MLLSLQPEKSKTDHELDELVPNLLTQTRYHSLHRCILLHRPVAVVSLEAASKPRANSTSPLPRRA